jgi:hypothetical protein
MKNLTVNVLQGIVLSQGKSCGTFLHLSAAAHQQFLLGNSAQPGMFNFS